MLNWILGQKETLHRLKNEVGKGRRPGRAVPGKPSGKFYVCIYFKRTFSVGSNARQAPRKMRNSKNETLGFCYGW